MANIPKIKAHKSILLEEVPDDVQKIIIAKQKEESGNCKCHRGQNYTLFKIVRDWMSTFGKKDSPIIMLDGHYQAIQDINVEFVGTEVVITAKLPITSKVGSLLNYERIQKRK